MLSHFAECRLRCPECRANALVLAPERVACLQCGSRFPAPGGKPVLIRRDNDLFAVDAYCKLPDRDAPGLRAFLFRLLPSASISLNERDNLEAFAGAVEAFIEPKVLVVGAGRQRQALEATLAAHQSISFTFCDVDARADIDLFCDAHELPFADASFHGLIASAVLEHVLYPERVAQQFHRVLCEGGILYTEVPFLQQVHEGAYDFTRYTLSGHRRLLNGFEELATGLIAGPGTVLAWTLENFALCFSRGPLSRLALRTSARLAFWWLKYLDVWLRRSPWAMDGASATFFLGRRLSDRTTSDSSIVDRYVGGGRIRHL